MIMKSTFFSIFFEKSNPQKPIHLFYKSIKLTNFSYFCSCQQYDFMRFLFLLLCLWAGAANAGSKVYKSMEEALKNPTTVTKLKLRGIDSLPASIGLLINLEELDLSRNKLKQEQSVNFYNLPRITFF